MINEILSRSEFLIAPPVLIDLGASGSLPEYWKDIASYCICLAFDGDEREFGYLESKNSGYKNLISINKVIATEEGIIDFYLTKSPYCSSSLEPDLENLKNYEFGELFKLEKQIKVNATTLNNVLTEINIDYIDWYKTDTQGTDLRILKSLSLPIADEIIVLELEPGIIDGYIGEDKFYKVLSYFNKKKYIVIEAIVKGSKRINLAALKGAANLSILPQTPDWCEVTFIKPPAYNSIRSYLLAFVFASIKNQHGLALEIATSGKLVYEDPIFLRMENYCISKFYAPIKGKFKSRFKASLKRLIDKF